MKSVVFAVFCVLAAIYNQDVFAQQEWTYLMTTDKGTDVYVARQKENNKIIQVWVKNENIPPVIVEGPYGTPTFAQKEVELDEFNCEQRRERTIDFTFYYKDGSTSTIDSTMQWRRIVPGTVYERVLQYLLDGKKRPKVDDTIESKESQYSQSPSQKSNR